MNWYDEREPWLDKGIRTLAKAGVDHVVALDGAYALFPDGHAQSPPSNAQTIRKACETIGAECSIHTPQSVWQGNEIEKRTFLFSLADQVAQPNVDWYLVWDADQHLGRCTDLKARLSQTDLDAGDLRVIEPPDERDNGNRHIPGTGVLEPTRTNVRLLYRAIPGIHCGRNHYTYLAPDGRVLWGNPNTDTLVEGLDLTDIHVLHKTKRRMDSRAARRIRYYTERDRSGAEDTVCHFCGTDGYTQGIAHSWEWTRSENRGWLLSGGLAPACTDCAQKHGTPRHRPMVLRCPECHGTASRNHPCRFCGTKGYKLHDPKAIQMNLRPALADDGRQGQPAVALKT